METKYDTQTETRYHRKKAQQLQQNYLKNIKGIPRTWTRQTRVLSTRKIQPLHS